MGLSLPAWLDENSGGCSKKPKLRVIRNSIISIAERVFRSGLLLRLSMQQNTPHSVELGKLLSHSISLLIIGVFSVSAEIILKLYLSAGVDSSCHKLEDL